ncbi:MAG: excisionase family DNA-binding protein [Chloracidobacterium sp.]|nr:excisionase family DNA-binding protein [Chloracidobacterium sp.]
MKLGNDTNDKLAFSVEEISSLTGLSKGFIRAEIRRRNIRIRRFGRRVLILRNDLDEYLTRYEETNVD